MRLLTCNFFFETMNVFGSHIRLNNIATTAGIGAHNYVAWQCAVCIFLHTVVFRFYHCLISLIRFPNCCAIFKF